MSRLGWCLAAFAIILPVMEVSGKEPSTSSLQEKRECIEQMKERTAALVAEDWSQLDTIARRFIRSCSDVLDWRYIADAYGAVASANNEMGHFEEALIQANAGTAEHYFGTSSHIEKLKALFALNRVEEAKKSFRVAERLIHSVIEQNDTDLQKAQTESDRELYLSSNALYQSQLKILDSYRPLLGNK